MSFAYLQTKVNSLRVLMPFLAVLALSGCAETQLISHYAKKMASSRDAQAVGSYKIGKPYKIGNVWYYPQEDFNLVETGIASWYGPNFHGKYTANGEIYDKYELTAAHRTLQMPSMVRVTNLENGRSIVVRINDRGPFARGRVIDMSKRGAELLGFIDKGTARVRVEVLPQESMKIAEAAKQGRDTSRMTLNDLREGDAIHIPAVAIHETPRRKMTVASLDDDSLPESLQTPTITVDELHGDLVDQPAAAAQSQPEQQPLAATPTPVKVHELRGNTVPDAVVSYQPVKPTGIFVQAGSFAVQSNAENLKMKLSAVAPVQVTPVMVNGRQLFRVRLGPLASVAEADRVLAKVLAAGGDNARVIRDPK